MNERIRLLAEQAGGEFYTGFSGSPNSIKFMENDFEKFAELIIQECLNTIATSKEARQTAYYYRNIVAEHFGVEE